MITRMVPLGALTVLLMSSSAATGQSAPGTYLTMQPESRLWVEGTSTVRGFTCNATKVDAALETSSSRAVSATLAGDKVVRSVRIEVPSRGLDCDNGTMNSHMYKAIKADAHPAIVFSLASYEVASSDGAPARLTLSGRLLLGGEERPIEMSAAAKETPDGLLQITGTYQLRLTEYGLKPPSLMLGTMKVGDVVHVKYDVLLKQ